MYSTYRYEHMSICEVFHLELVEHLVVCLYAVESTK
jgi:hypothetical protein